MKKFDKKALSEVYSLIELLDEESYQKIPENLIYGIKKNMDNFYEVDTDKLLNGEYLQETKDILCAIYIKYLATEEELELIQIQFDLPQCIFGSKTQKAKNEEGDVEEISNKIDKANGI